MSTVSIPLPEVRNGELLGTASIRPAGAMVDSLQVNGFDILTPLYTDEWAERGGTYWAEPFGPVSDEPDAANHGNLRRAAWEQDENRESTLYYVDENRGLAYQLDSGLFALDDGVGFEQMLLISNRNDQPVLVAPAAHPYFNLSLADAVKQPFLRDSGVGEDTVLEGVELEETFGAAKPVELQMAGFTVSLFSNMTRRTIWSPADGRALCIEPSAVGQPFGIRTEGVPRFDEVQPSATSPMTGYWYQIRVQKNSPT